MRRMDREVTSFPDIIDILSSSTVIHLSMVDDGRPYVVPMNFGFETDGKDIILYFHSAKEGRKIDILRKNPEVFFELDSSHKLIKGDSACSYSFGYQSIMGSGRAVFHETHEETRHALSCLMKHVGNLDNPTFTDKALDAVTVFSIRSSDYTAKRH